MTRLPFLRQVLDPAPNSGAWNMAVDELLLQSAIDSELATLRWYTWREPTVSIGYFQNEADIALDARLARLPRVRRLTGGGTLVHHHELTYSLSLPAKQRVVERPMDLYRVVHAAFIEEFRRRGVELEMRGQTIKLASEPVLCFARQDEHDVVLRGHKVLGSAQRRRRGAILQHGGLVLQTSPITPEIVGLADLSPAVKLDGLAESLGRQILETISQSSRNEPLSADEQERASLPRTLD